MRRLSLLLTALLAGVLALVAPVKQAIVKAKTELSITLAAVLPWIFAPLEVGSTPGPPADPGLPPGEIFINKLLVLGSSVGLCQTTLSLNFLGGWAYDTRNYLRVTQAAPSNPHFVEGIATDSTGAVHIYDSSAGLPVNVRWQHGLPLTQTGQLCVVFG
jgi:hypothetical protein